MKRKDGFRNYNELSEEDIDFIIEEYYKSDLKVRDLSKKLCLTNRTLPMIFKKRGINSSRKNKYTLDEKYFNSIDTERKAYWLGYLYADGFIGDNAHNNIIFSQKITDSYIIEQFAEDISFTGKLRISNSISTTFLNGQPQFVINFSSRTMADDLRALNMNTKKSMTMKELPPIEASLFRHFVRGYFDGDGTIVASERNSYKDRIYLCVHWNIIGTIDFLKKIAEKLPIKTFFYDSKTPEMKYLSSSSKKSICSLYNYLYDEASFYLKRKHDVFQKIIGLNSKETWN